MCQPGDAVSGGGRAHDDRSPQGGVTADVYSGLISQGCHDISISNSAQNWQWV
jgi:hypothetical protein